MTQLDLLPGGPQLQEESCDVCVVGAGAAGLYLATRLADRGLDVVVLEAGDAVCDDGASCGMLPEFLGEIYRGATIGRAFGLGGSTSRWGGLLVPHSPHDFRPVPPDRWDAWRHIVSKVTERTDGVLADLGFDRKGDFFQLPGGKLKDVTGNLGSSGMEAVAGLFLPFRRRNLAFLLKERRGQRRNLKIWLNAVTTNWEFQQGDSALSRCGAVVARSRSGRQVRVKARQVVLAAGGIESARILLEIRGKQARPALSQTAAIGQCLADHLSCPIAEVASADRDRIARLFRPWFARGKMRSLRLVESRPPPDAPRCFTHFVFAIDNPAFFLAKEYLLALQSRRWPKTSFRQLVSGTAGLASFAFARYARSVLHVPPGTPVCLQLDIEQAPNRSNAVRLGSRLDVFGRPVAEIAWRVSPEDDSNIRDAAGRILGLWQAKSSGLAELQPVLSNGASPKPHDAYHPVGTCRLGLDPESVVDPQLRVQGTGNLWVLSTAVLPSAGTANPTFTMLCLGKDLAETLTALVKP